MVFILVHVSKGPVALDVLPVLCLEWSHGGVTRIPSNLVNPPHNGFRTHKPASYVHLQGMGTSIASYMSVLNAAKHEIDCVTE